MLINQYNLCAYEYFTPDGDEHYIVSIPFIENDYYNIYYFKLVRIFLYHMNLLCISYDIKVSLYTMLKLNEADFLKVLRYFNKIILYYNLQQFSK